MSRTEKTRSRAMAVAGLAVAALEIAGCGTHGAAPPRNTATPPVPPTRPPAGAHRHIQALTIGAKTDACKVFTRAEITAIMGTSSWKAKPSAASGTGSLACRISIAGPSEMEIILELPGPPTTRAWKIVSKSMKKLDSSGRVLSPGHGLVDDAWLPGGYVLSAISPTQPSGYPLPGAEKALLQAMEGAVARWG